jgi:hypothetical protein
MSQRELTGESFEAIKLWTDDFQIFFASKIKLRGEKETKFGNDWFHAVTEDDKYQFRVIPKHEENPLRLQPNVFSDGETVLQLAYPEYDERELTMWFRRGLGSFFNDKLLVMWSVRLMCFGPRSREKEFIQQTMDDKRKRLRYQIGLARKARKIEFGGWEDNNKMQPTGNGPGC